jgi:hypothetical protein
MRDGAPLTTVFWRNVAILIALLGIFYAFFSRVALHAFPFSGDEYSYFLQAELFARGRLRAPAPPHPELLRVDHVIIDDWVRSKYPPGTSALLSFGVRWGAAWLVTPIEGMVALIAMGTAARRLLCDRDALIVVALLGAAPLFAFQAGSFFSHTATTMWLSIAFAAVVAWSCDGRSVRLVVGGAAIGCALLTRPLDALLFCVALVSLRSVRALALTAAGAAPFVILHFAYQAAQFGSPFVDGYAAYAPTFRAIYGASAASSPLSIAHVFTGLQPWNHLDVIRALLIDWTVPGTGLLAVLGYVALRDDPRTLRARRFAASVVAVFVLSLFVTIADTDDGARPRYLSTTLLPLAWLAAPGWRVAGEFLEQRLGCVTRRIVGVVVWLLAPLQLAAFLFVRTPLIEIRQGLEVAVKQAGVEEGVVIVRARYPTRYARNGPFFERAVLYVSAPVTSSADDIAAAFPGRPVYEAREMGKGEDWSLVRLR